MYLNNLEIRGLTQRIPAKAGLDDNDGFLHMGPL